MYTEKDFDFLGIDDPVKRKAAFAQMTSAKDVADYYEYQEKQMAAVAARNKVQADAQREKDLIERVRYEASERASKEKEQVELLRYQETKRLSLIAIGIAILSAIVSLFK